MVNRLDRFDEVWAEVEQLPSPYCVAQQELAQLLVEQTIEDIKISLHQALKQHLGVDPRG